MTSMKAREFLRAHVLGLVAIFIALSGTAIAGQSSSGDDPSASASAVSNAKFKKLKQRVAALEGTVTTLQNRPTPAAPVIPTSLPPSGPAGGVLDGTYPNPGLGDNTVGVTELIDGNVNSAKVADNSLGRIDLAVGSIGAPELSDSITVRAANVIVPGGTAQNAAYDTEAATASCAAGEEVIAGGTTWVGGPFIDAELWTGEMVVFQGTEQVQAVGGNDSGTDRTFQVHAYCLI